MSDKQETSGAGLDRWQRAAILMVTLGQDLAGELLGQFEDDEVECITRAIADLKNIPRQIQDDVIAEFEHDLKTGRLQGVGGGHDIASDFLQSALGPERAAQMMQRLSGAPAWCRVSGSRQGRSVAGRAVYQARTSADDCTDDDAAAAGAGGGDP